MTKRILIALAALVLSGALLAGCTGDVDVPTDATLDIDALKVGKADAFVIRTKEHVLLLDTAYKENGDAIVSHLEEAGIEKIDYLIITHFDKDHVGGAAKVIKSVAVENVLQSNSPKESTEYSNYISALSDAGITPVTVRELTTFELDGVKFTIDPPAEDEYSKDPSNNSSLIVSINCGGRKLLFMGDAENERIEEYLRKGLAEKCDFVKMPHHGKWSKRIRELIAATTPKYALITSSELEPEEEKTTELLDSCKVETFLTREAPVTVSCKDGDITVSYQN